MEFCMQTGPRLYDRARRLIPGGTQLLSKRPEMFLPGQWPAYYAWAKGAKVADLDGRVYTDMSISGVGACLLGYSDPDVSEAVRHAVEAGSMCTLNCPEEVELAELLCELHPWAEMVRYARCGGEAMSVAVRIARAATGRDVVAFCGYHGWSDWYLAANLASAETLNPHLLAGLDPNGVPRGLEGTAIPFRYNRADELRAIADSHHGRLAAVVMEPVRDKQPDPGFLDEVRSIADQTGAVLIADEVSMGWRLVTGGAHLNYGLLPGIAVFAKAISNGHPMAAIIGTRRIMEAAQASFISSTYWTDRVGPAAALATIRKLRRENVAANLALTGDRIKAGWREAADRAGLDITIGGLAPLPRFTLNCAEPQTARTLFTQLMLDRGHLATNTVYVTWAHRDAEVTGYLQAVENAFVDLARAVARGSVPAELRGPVAHSGFQRLTG